MNVAGLGELHPYDGVEGWLESGPRHVPLLGVPLRFVVMDVDLDVERRELESVVAAFLSLGSSDRADAGEYVHRYHLAIVEAMDDMDDEVEVQIASPSQVWTHVRPTEIQVSHRGRRDTRLYVRVVAECDWEVEHGLQLVYREGKALTRVSSQDGHLTWTDAFDLPENEDRIWMDYDDLMTAKTRR